MKPEGVVLAKADWRVDTVPLTVAADLVSRFHYAKRGPNTATFRHGLIRKSDGAILGVAWWIPPTKSAALATYPVWRAVLSLCRLVCSPEAPTNAESFLIAASIKLIRKDPRWLCLVTYADEGYQGHAGTIYRATNWKYLGKTQPEACWTDPSGAMVSRKAGPHTRTKQEMLDLGFKMIGKFSKHKYAMEL